MKKIVYLIAVCMGGVLTACDPGMAYEASPAASITEDALRNTVTLTQTTPNANKFTFTTDPTTYVQILDQDGNIIASGTDGEITATPPLTALQVRAINQDGSITSFSQEYTVTEYLDVPAIYGYLFGQDFTSKTWVWDTESPSGVMSNGAYMEAGLDGSNHWFTISADAINEEAVNRGLPEDGSDAWMRFTLAGRVVETNRGESGTISWDLSSIVKEGWDQGKLTFNGTIPPMGIQFNNGNARQYEYLILRLDDEHLNLCAPEPGAGDWGTAWFWDFKAAE